MKKNPISKLSLWVTGGIPLAVYAITLIITTLVTKTPHFWAELFGAQRFRSGFILYSLPFIIIGVLMILIGRLNLKTSRFVVAQLSALILCVLALVLAGVLLIVFATGFDWKMMT